MQSTVSNLGGKLAENLPKEFHGCSEVREARKRKMLLSVFLAKCALKQSVRQPEKPRGTLQYLISKCENVKFSETNFLSRLLKLSQGKSEVV